ncbi:MAG: FAD-binding oxidoreductase, partial [Armatimonadota bacterium]|nr:FAD-binding oxidoreductase [Armatimonadota bacterium]
MQRREFLQLGLAAALGALGEPGACAATPDVAHLGGRVVLPGQPGYDAARQDHNARIVRAPAAVVFCRNAADIAGAVGWARRNHVPLRVRCGGHSYEGYSLVDDGLVIDVSALNRVHLDAAGQTARVGAGVRLLDLYEALWPHRVTVPGGSCATVGIAGLTLGGGYGLLARRFGLTCDHLNAAEMVLADGSVVRADAQNHADLLWACRGGGGGSFGIATEFTFRVRPVNTVAVYRLTWGWDDLNAVLNAWQSWAPTVDDRLTCLLKLRARSNGTLTSVGQFIGSAAELTALLGPLRRAGTPREATVETLGFLDACRRFAGVTPGAAALTERTHFKASS